MTNIFILVLTVLTWELGRHLVRRLLLQWVMSRIQRQEPSAEAKALVEEAKADAERQLAFQERLAFLRDCPLDTSRFEVYRTWREMRALTGGEAIVTEDGIEEDGSYYSAERCARIEQILRAHDPFGRRGAEMFDVAYQTDAIIISNELIHLFPKSDAANAAHVTDNIVGSLIMMLGVDRVMSARPALTACGEEIAKAIADGL